jgi:uncharacterized repeat protein (TIGR01451 family)
MCLLAMALLALSLVAWQGTPPLSLTVTVDPEVVSTGETFTLTFTVSNTGDSPLDAVALLVDVPQGTELEDAQAAEGWTVRVPGAVEYRARDAFAPDQSAQLVLTLLVRQAAGGSILLERYVATAEQLSTPVEGEPVTIWVGVAPTLSPTGTASPTPTAAATATRAEATSTPTTTATATRTATPTATITLGPVELPPTATPTPNLTSEQVVVGTVTVSVFVGIVVVLIVLAVVWVVRTARRDREA